MTRPFPTYKLTSFNVKNHSNGQPVDYYPIVGVINNNASLINASVLGYGSIVVGPIEFPNELNTGNVLIVMTNAKQYQLTIGPASNDEYTISDSEKTLWRGVDLKANFELVVELDGQLSLTQL